jgi:hypothetical protein
VGEVTLRCKTCTEAITRAFDYPHEWVHVDDWISLENPLGTYDHDPVPDVLDIV